MKNARSRIFVAAMILVIGSAVAPLYGQSNTNKSAISGFVFGPDRRPLSQVWVELANDVNRIMGRVRTDGSGRFYFRDLPNGRYTLKALPLGTGLMEQSEDVELSGIGSRGQVLADNQQRDIYLRARKASSRVPFQNTVVYSQIVPKEAEDAYNVAIEDIDRSRVPSGIAGLERATEIFPTYFVALQKLGLVRLTQGEFGAAIMIFERALAVNSRCFDCWYGIAYSQYTLKKFPEAVTATEKALVESPDSVEANVLLGTAGRAVKDFDKAESALRRAVKASDGKSADAHWQLALLYGKDTKRFAEAAKELESFLKLSPEAPNKEAIKKLIKQFRDQAASSA